LELALQSDHRFSLQLLGIVLPEENKIHYCVPSLLDEIMLFCLKCCCVSAGYTPMPACARTL